MHHRTIVDDVQSDFFSGGDGIVIGGELEIGHGNIEGGGRSAATGSQKYHNEQNQHKPFFIHQITLLLHSAVCMAVMRMRK
jgi:hypothetical protein